MEDLRAKDEPGQERRVTKTRRNRWRVEAAGAAGRRRDLLVTLRATFAKEPWPRKLEVRPDATDEQKQKLAAWLGPGGD